MIDLLDVPGLLYSPDGTTFDSDVFYPTLPSFVCPIYKGFCGGDRLDFWTRPVSITMFHTKSHNYVVDSVPTVVSEVTC